MGEHSLRKTRRHIKKATKQQQTNKIQKQRSATHCDVRHGTSCCDVRRAGGSRGSSFSGDSYKSIAFCNIRGGGRGSGGVILYEKNMATDLAPVILPSKRKKYSTSPAAIGAFRRHFVESIAMFRRRIGHKHGHHREYYKNCHFCQKLTHSRAP